MSWFVKDLLCSNVIDQIGESEIELKRCLTSYHIDFFLYRVSLDKFVSVFSLLVNSSDRIRELLSDSRSARAYDACLLLSGEKLKSVTADSSTAESLKSCLTTLADYFLLNFDEILDTQIGIFAMRSFLKVIGKSDPIESSSQQHGSNGQKTAKRNEFSLRSYDFRTLPLEWNLHEYLKKFYKKIKDKNTLG